MSDRISIVIAEDSLLVRDSLSRALSTDPDVTVVGVAEDYDSAVELVEKHAPTMLVTDVRMPPTKTDEGIRLAQWMRTAQPDVGVIVLSNYVDPRYAAGLLEGGTAGRGYLLKERVSHFDELNEAVRQVAGGGTVLDPLVVEALLSQPRSAPTLSRLTPREREVLSELATGFSNRTIAAAAGAVPASGGKAHQLDLRQTRTDRRRRCRPAGQGSADVPRRPRNDVIVSSARPEMVVCTPSRLANNPGTMAGWWTSACESGSSMTRPVSGGLPPPLSMRWTTS